MVAGSPFHSNQARQLMFKNFKFSKSRNMWPWGISSQLCKNSIKYLGYFHIFWIMQFWIMGFTNFVIPTGLESAITELKHWELWPVTINSLSKSHYLGGLHQGPFHKNSKCLAERGLSAQSKYDELIRKLDGLSRVVWCRSTRSHSKYGLDNYRPQ